MSQITKGVFRRLVEAINLASLLNREALIWAVYASPRFALNFGCTRRLGQYKK